MDLRIAQDVLHKMLLLEKSQVVLYSSLASKAQGEDLVYGLRRLAKTEYEHVLNIEGKLAELFPRQGGKLRQWKNSVVDAGLKGFGSLVSTAQGLAGLGVVMKYAAMAEERAMADYRKSIVQIRDPELKAIFWQHLIDEELHYLWLKEKAVQLMNKSGSH